MKKLLLSAPILALSLAACSQTLPAEKVPSVVQNALKARFADAAALEWNKAGTTYEAEFTQGANELEVRVSEAGQVLSVKQDLTLAELPGAITEAIAAQFKDYKIDDAERVENNGQVYYQVELEKFLSEKQLVFSPEGQIAANTEYWD